MSYPNKMLELDLLRFGQSVMGDQCVYLDDHPIANDGKTAVFRLGIRPTDSAPKEDLRIYASMHAGNYYLTAIAYPLDPLKRRQITYEPDDLTDFVEILPSVLQ